MLTPNPERIRFYHSVILSPVITEKSMHAADALGKYSFRVSTRANKVQIHEAVEKLFDVHVLAVNTMNVQGKSRRHSWKHRTGKTAQWKKAIVTLAPGERIAKFEVA